MTNNKILYILLLIANTFNFCTLIKYFSQMSLYEILGLVGMYGWASFYLLDKYRKQ